MTAPGEHPDGGEYCYDVIEYIAPRSVEYAAIQSGMETTWREVWPALRAVRINAEELRRIRLGSDAERLHVHARCIERALMILRGVPADMVPLVEACDEEANR